jgi:hypothetical protein
MVLMIDEPIPDDILRQITQIDGMEAARQVQL